MLEIAAQCNSKVLLYDEACFHISSFADVPVQIWSQSSECYKCDFLPWVSLLPNGNVSFVVKAVHAMYLFYVNVREESNYCREQFSFVQHGIYGWNISDSFKCSPVFTIKPPDNPYSPLYVLFILLTLSSLMWIGVRSVCLSNLVRRLRSSNPILTEIESDLGSPTSSGDSIPLVRSELIPVVRRFSTRVQSLDTFRGLAIAMMIFVNYGGGKYWFFKHSVWNGVTVADFVFPWFAWMMGCGLAMSLRSQLREGLPRLRILYRCTRRAAMLVALGVVLNTVGTSDLHTIRLPGVLQRLALAYLLVALLETPSSKQQAQFQWGRRQVVQDLLETWPQWMGVALLVAFHSYVTFFMPVPGCPTGYIGPGGLHNHSHQVNCTGGAAGYIDRHVFGYKHIYQRPTSHKVYNSNIPYDPEGLLGVLTTTLMVYFGVHAGRILLCYHYSSARVVRWLMWAAITGISAGFLCGWSKEGGLIPLNKNLWSLSYVLAMSSSAFILQSTLFFVIDHGRWWSGAPFRQAGMNSILLYVCHVLLKDTFPWSWQPFHHRTHAEYLGMNAWATALWVFIAVILERNSVFVNV